MPPQLYKLYDRGDLYTIYTDEYGDIEMIVYLQPDRTSIGTQVAYEDLDSRIQAKIDTLISPL